MDKNEIWQKTLPLIEEHPEMTQVVFDTYLATIKPVSFENGVLTLMTSTDFYKSTVSKRHFSKLLSLSRVASGIDDLEVNIISPEDLNSPKTNNANVVSLNYESTNLRQKYVFETFVKGKCNELAYSAAKAVAETPGSSPYNPLFLYGGVGLGKTHLMHAIGNLVKDHNPSAKVVYCSTETFMNELVFSIQNKDNVEFRNKYRETDVLLIDDIQFLSEKEKTQEEFFHTFNFLRDANKQIVISSDKPPRDIKTLEDRLVSRFGQGIIVDLQVPDLETRIAILEKKADDENLEIPTDITHYLAKNIASNVRDLEGALNKLSAMSKLSEQKITLERAEHIVKEIIGESAKRDVTIELIQNTVAEHYSITLADIKSKRRTQNVAYPRQIAMYLCRKLMDESSTKIGAAFAKDHSTIIHGCEKIAFDAEHDINLRNILFDLENKIVGIDL